MNACPLCNSRSTRPDSLLAESYLCGTYRRYGEDEYCCSEQCKQWGGQGRLIAAIERSGFALSLCTSCAQPVVCLPGKPPLCVDCEAS